MGGINYQPLINNVAYDWSDVIVNIMGHTFIGISSIEYEEKQDKQDNFGAGRRPVNRGYGNIKATAKITLFQEEVLALEALVPGDGTIQDLPTFDIIVMYMSNPSLPIKDVIKNCQFTNNVRTLKQNDMNVEVAFELITSHILWNQ